MTSLLAAALCLAAPLPKEQKIFDGKSMAGWEVVGGGTWTIEPGGVLKGVCAKADDQGILVYKKPVKNFKARLEFKIAGGNSGFYFRAERITDQPLVKGMQAEIDAIDDVGGIWETAGRGWVYKPTPEVHARAHYKPGEWTKMTVSAIGDHYVVTLNGATITDLRDTEGRREGAIALQLHGGMDMTVEFRNIFLEHVD